MDLAAYTENEGITLARSQMDAILSSKPSLLARLSISHTATVEHIINDETAAEHPAKNGDTGMRQQEDIPAKTQYSAIRAAEMRMTENCGDTLQG